MPSCTVHVAVTVNVTVTVSARLDVVTMPLNNVQQAEPCSTQLQHCLCLLSGWLAASCLLLTHSEEGGAPAGSAGRRHKHLPQILPRNR